MLQVHNLKVLSVFILMSALIGSADIASAQPIVKIDGSSTVYPITKAIAKDFQVAKKDAVKVMVNISGSGGGFKKFCHGEIDIVNASRPILKNEMAECKNSRVKFVEIPIAFDAITVAVHPDNNWSTTMTIAQLRKIWEPIAQGRITKWNQINPAWPNEDFKLFGADSASGTFDYFTKAIVGKSKLSRGDYIESEDDKLLVEGVASNKNGLGFFGFHYYIENQDKVKAVAIDSGNGGVLPSVETVENGSYRPLSRPIFIYVSIKAAEKPEVKQFIEFYLKNALLQVKKAEFVPLPPSAYRIMLEHFNNKRAGSVFNGKPAIGLTIDEMIRREGRTEFEHY
ncbi:MULTISPECIES: PstS family phosphate ABC transporter substrate-binding protein [Nitrosomonas]|uniref:Phosphate-binding protein n=1 Tax=Nitrosomonas communis TaxID=44574 RepID=A0A0F7KDV7_9PROT|nr:MULTISPECIES: PstS family phosphate ABC transporter substrate-binding protein [Nitrosomonas]AKH36964.1 protein sphX [Nitrosomonas communis]TYP87717.1 phosphate transport system substrate-binding protein [Nitrosomonas communis]UVS62104.1 PstS family phosphate ABC transporter substrate-binding protein [Nitrosomonas sp. PLL12]